MQSQYTGALLTAFEFTLVLGSSSLQLQNLVPVHLGGKKRLNAALLVLRALAKILLDKFPTGLGPRHTASENSSFLSRGNLQLIFKVATHQEKFWSTGTTETMLSQVSRRPRGKTPLPASQHTAFP